MSFLGNGRLFNRIVADGTYSSTLNLNWQKLPLSTLAHTINDKCSELFEEESILSKPLKDTLFTDCVESSRCESCKNEKSFLLGYLIKFSG